MTSAGELVATVVKAVVVFAGTNVDDIVLLMVLFADPQLRPRNIVAGQFLGIAILVAVSVVAGALAVAIPAGWLSLLGAIPLAIGVSKAVRAIRTRGNDNEGDTSDKIAGSSQVLAVTGVTLANGADNLGVYIPLFAIERRAILVYTATFGLMTVIWCAAGFKLVNNGTIGNKIRRYGHIALPVVLILLGIQILSGIRVLL